MRWAFSALAAAMLLFLVAPLIGLGASISFSELAAGLSDPIALAALKLSFLTTVAALIVIVICGTPLAWWIGRSNQTLARIVEAAIELPIVLPPAVAGVALLLTYGRSGLNWGIVFTTIAVIVAQIFVAAPFFLRSAVIAFRSLDEDLLLVARSTGAKPSKLFFRIALPLALPGLAGGAALCWARALGEFGATLMFAGNLPGRTQTLPLAIYGAMESNFAAAQALSVVLVLVALIVLVTARRLNKGW